MKINCSIRQGVIKHNNRGEQARGKVGARGRAGARLGERWKTNAAQPKEDAKYCARGKRGEEQYCNPSTKKWPQWKRLSPAACLAEDDVADELKKKDYYGQRRVTLSCAQWVQSCVVAVKRKYFYAVFKYFSTCIVFKYYSIFYIIFNTYYFSILVFSKYFTILPFAYFNCNSFYA